MAMTQQQKEAERQGQKAAYYAALEGKNQKEISKAYDKGAAPYAAPKASPPPATEPSAPAAQPQKTTSQKRQEAEQLYAAYTQSEEYKKNLLAAGKAQTDAWMMEAITGKAEPMAPAGDQKEQQLKALVEHYKALEKQERNQEIIDASLKELETWSPEDRQMLEAYWVQDAWERQHPMADPITGGSRQVSGEVAAPLIDKYGEATIRKLAEALEIPFYDNELITMAAEKTGLSVECFKDAEKTSIGNLFFSLTSLTPSIDAVGLPLNEKIFLVQSQVIKEVAAEGPCVIVGRSANCVLQDNPNVINVFLQADLPDRVKRAIDTYGQDADGAEALVVKTDKRRANYYNYFTGGKWGKAENYDLILNTSRMDLDKIVEVIKTYVSLR